MTTETRTTAETYFDLPAYASEPLIQLIDGEVVIGVPPLLRHQDIVGNIYSLLRAYAKQHGGLAYFAPAEIVLDDTNVYEPDALYVSPEPICTVQAKRILGPPDLVAEVLSPSSVKHDRETKYKAYERHGVREYWIADPLNTYVDVFVLQGGAFVKQGLYVPGDTFASTVLAGQTVTVADLFE